MATGNWFESWDSLVHTIFSRHQHVSDERKYSSSELHSSLNTEPKFLLQATEAGHSSVFGIDTDILYQCPSEVKWFPSFQNSFLTFLSWSPRFWNISVRLVNLPHFPPTLRDFRNPLSLSFPCSQFPSLFLQQRPWSFSTLLLCIFSTTKASKLLVQVFHVF